MRKKVCFLVVFTLMIVLAASFRFRVAAQSIARVYLDPAMIYRSPGESFTVDIKIADVINLYSWQVNLSFNPDVLQFVSVTEGDFLSLHAPNGTETVAPKIEEGWAGFGWMITGDFIGPSGSGWLGTVEFETKPGTTGESVLNISQRLTKLWEYIPPPPPPGKEKINPIERTTDDAFFTNQQTPPHAEFTYSPSAPGIGEEITFNASASYATNHNITQFTWDFGDGTYEIYVKDVNLTTTTTHSYTQSGAYNVILTVMDDATPSALMSSFFDTTTMPLIWYDLYATYTPPGGVVVFATVDAAVVNVQVSKTQVQAGETVDITATVRNFGVSSEDFDVTAQYDEIEIGTESVTAIGPGETRTVDIIWDTTGVTPGVYTISAEATLEGDTNPANDRKLDGTVEVLASGSFGLSNEMIIGIIVVVVVAGIGVFFFLRRRRTP